MLCYGTEQFYGYIQENYFHLNLVRTRTNVTKQKGISTVLLFDVHRKQTEIKYKKKKKLN